MFKKRSLIITTLLILMTAFAVFANAGILPHITISPNPLDFPDTRVGTTADAQTITVTNTSSILPVYIFSTGLADSEDFNIVSDGCTKQTIPPGDNCKVQITFLPNNQGHYSTSFTLIGISHGIISSSIINGRGIEPVVVLSASSINFGDQTVGKSSCVHNVVLTNAGSTALSVSSIAASDNFTVTDDCGDSVSPLTDCTIGITFDPPATGNYTGTATITDDASDSPQTIALSGKGITPGNPDVSLSKHSIAFGSHPVGVTTDPETVTVTNSGTANLTITGIAVSENFGLTDDCPDTLAPDEICTLSITFTPADTETFSGSVVITDDATDSPQTIGLSGTGVQSGPPLVNLSATSVDFGNQDVNTPSAPQTITLTNAGSEDLNIQTVTIDGESASSYSKNDTCHESTLQVGGTCSISVAFTPATDGALAATITITDNASDSPQTIALTGVGVGSSSSSGGCSLIIR